MELWDIGFWRRIGLAFTLVFFFEANFVDIAYKSVRAGTLYPMAITLFLAAIFFLIGQMCASVQRSRHQLFFYAGIGMLLGLSIFMFYMAMSAP
jgi:hypothetical protein